MEEKAFPPNTKLLGIKRLDNVMKKPVKLSFLEKIVSGFKKTIAVGMFALSGLLPSGCISMEEASLHSNIAYSVSDQGRKKIEEGDLENGIKYLKEAAEIEEPDMFDAYHLGMDFKKKGDLENAEKYFRIAASGWVRDVALNDKIKEIRENAFFELGEIYSHQDKQKKASKSFLNVTKVNPSINRYRDYESHANYIKSILTLYKNSGHNRKKRVCNKITHYLSNIEINMANDYCFSSALCLLGKEFMSLGDKETKEKEKINLYKKAIYYFEEAQKGHWSSEAHNGEREATSKLDDTIIKITGNEDIYQSGLMYNREEVAKNIKYEDRSVGINIIFLAYPQNFGNVLCEVGATTKISYKLEKQRRFMFGAVYEFAFGAIGEGDENWEGEEGTFHIKGGIEICKNLFLIGGVGHSEKSGRAGTPYHMEDEDYTTISAELRYVRDYFAMGIGNHNRRVISYSLGILIPLE